MQIRLKGCVALYLWPFVAFLYLLDLSWIEQGNRKSAGFTDEERKSFETNFLEKGFVDTFRQKHPDIVGYTYWGYRHGGRKTNKGIPICFCFYFSSVCFFICTTLLKLSQPI